MKKIINLLVKHKIVVFMILLYILWEIIKGNVVFAFIIFFSFTASFVIFALVIFLYEKKNHGYGENKIIQFPLENVPEKVVVCDMCGELISNNSCNKVSNKHDIIVCDNCKLKS